MILIFKLCIVDLNCAVLSQVSAPAPGTFESSPAAQEGFVSSSGRDGDPVPVMLARYEYLRVFLLFLFVFSIS